MKFGAHVLNILICFHLAFSFDKKFANEKLCKNVTIDAAVKTKDQNIYFFKGDAYWRISINRVYKDYPRPMSDWKGVETPIWAAFTWKNGTTVIITKNRYWCFVNKTPLPGYPKDVLNEFTKDLPNPYANLMPNDGPSAAMALTSDDVVNFFYDNFVCTYIEKNKTLAEPLFSQIDRMFYKVYEDPNAVLHWSDGITFFKDQTYIHYKHNSKEPVRYMQPTALDWLQCKKDNQPLYSDEKCCRRMRMSTNKPAPWTPTCPKVSEDFKQRKILVFK